jgi:hypothetical protein
MSEALSVIEKGVDRIVTDSNVVNATQNLITTSLAGAGSIVVSTGAAVIGTGSVAGISATVSATTTAISSAAATVGSAIVTATIAAAPILIIGGVLWLLLDD